MGFLRSGYHGSEGHLGTIWGPGLEVRSEGHLGSIWGQSEVNPGPYLRNLSETSRKAFIWPWVGSLTSEYTKYGSWDWSGGDPV